MEVERGRIEPEFDPIAEGFDEGEEFFEHFRFTPDPGQHLLRIDKYLFNLLPQTSRNRIQQAAKAGSIWVNGKPVKQNHRVKPGELIQVVLSKPPRHNELLAEDLPLDILFQDDHLMIIDKKPGMVVHPAHGHHSGTLVNGVLHLIRQLPPGTASERPGLVHRIDKNTSGILVIALNEYAMAHLSRQFFERTTHRLYEALVWGALKEDKGTVVAHVGRHLKERKLYAAFPDGSHGKHAVTHYTVLERLGYLSRIECKLETGRTHQIRVHMQSIGHPLFADDFYGGDKVVYGPKNGSYAHFVENTFQVLPRQALHAKVLGFEHPVTGAWMEFESPLPEDMALGLDRWRNYAAGSLV